MLKRHGSEIRRDKKRHGSSLSVEFEFLPHDVIELILERLPVESLRRFRSVSKKWRSTIDSPRFQERQLNLRKQSRGHDLLFVAIHEDPPDDAAAPLVLGASSCTFRTVKFPFPNLLLCYGSCDGLVCLFCMDTPNVVVNPATQWHRTFPFSSVQRLIIDRYNIKRRFYPLTCQLGFGKDNKLSSGGTYKYKPVWLYNSSEFGLDNVTTCEVFEFSTDTWRYVVPASPYRILEFQKPVYFDGSLYWLTDCEETKVLSFHLHTETFQVICKTPFADAPADTGCVILFILDNCLCASEKSWPTQVIWSLDDSSKTWKKMCSIDLTDTLPWFNNSCPLVPLPVAILEKNKLYLQSRRGLEPLVLHDLHTKSYEVVSTPTTPGDCIYYFESLFSV
ncbi:unnamed protein product [Eruca vesicaria subsp. sativa]|uniref:F-box domain-containing protein n=1 Tax=Eruca vesicaria subsp. sativa TaxID=29727 RepID=A0ABC8LL88_ERUVS|nr:unnamed protein product [Eruca vesicaria subsp. sativa]